jgi:DNA polymerase III delta prime subunit
MDNVWMEKYRPTKMDDIILEETNKIMFKNVLETGYFPNMLFYGSPGTGKTTTIINLIKEYQVKYNGKYYDDCIIHLNASDDRGINVIRNMLYSFIYSNTDKRSFVILDEVDYMTKSAQKLLNELINNYNGETKFCLLCNYISKIDVNLLNEFILVRFNNNSSENIIKKLEEILNKENKKINRDVLKAIQVKYNNDIRSMINHIQINNNIIRDEEIKEIILKMDYNKIKRICKKCNISRVDLMINIFEYIIKNEVVDNLSELITNMERLIHNNDEVEYLKYCGYIIKKKE